MILNADKLYLFCTCWINKASKLGLKKNKSIVSVYGSYQLVQFNHSSLITTFVASSNANTGKFWISLSATCVHFAGCFVRMIHWPPYWFIAGVLTMVHVLFDPLAHLGLLLELGSELESVTQVIATALHERHSGAL